MNIPPLQRTISAADIPPERLAGNSSLSHADKVAEASRQFEAMLLRQILASAQKTVIRSDYTDDSTASEIYRDLVTTQLADSISRSGAFGLTNVLTQQLSQPAADSADSADSGDANTDSDQP